MKENKDIDKLVQDAFRDFEMPFNEEHWKEMDKMLDDEPSGGLLGFKGGNGFRLLGLAALVMLSVGSWYIFNNLELNQAQIDRQPSASEEARTALVEKDIDIVSSGNESTEASKLFGENEQAAVADKALGNKEISTASMAGINLPAKEKAAIHKSIDKTSNKTSNTRINESKTDLISAAKDAQNINNNISRQSTNTVNPSKQDSDLNSELDFKKDWKADTQINAPLKNEPKSNLKTKEPVYINPGRGEDFDELQQKDFENPSTDDNAKELNYLTVQTEKPEEIKAQIDKNTKAETIESIESIANVIPNNTSNNTIETVSDEISNTNIENDLENDIVESANQDLEQGLEQKEEQEFLVDTKQVQQENQESSAKFEVNSLAYKTPLLAQLEEKEVLLINNVKMPLDFPMIKSKAYKKMNVGVATSLDVNFVDNFNDLLLGYSAGIKTEFESGALMGWESGIYFSNKRYRSSNIKTPQYITGNAQRSQIDYKAIEIPILVKFNFLNKKKINLSVGLGQSMFYSTYKKYFIESDQDVSNLSFQNGYDARSSSRIYESVTISQANSDDLSRSSDLNSFVDQTIAMEFDSSAPSGTSSADNLGYFSDVAYLPLTDKNSFVRGIFNLNIGLKYRLNSRQTLGLDFQYKESLSDKKLDIEIDDYGILNEGKYKSAGLRISYQIGI